MKNLIKKKNSENTTLIGFFFAFIVLVGDGFQTIVNNSRPSHIDPLFFAWISACVELVFIFPFALFSTVRKKKAKQTQSISEVKDWWKLLIAGLIFSVCAYYLIVGFSLVDSVTGILAVKTQPISMIFIGAIMLKERLTFKEIIIALIMFILIAFVTTKGTFSLGNISNGVLILLMVPIFWNIGHSILKPYLSQKLLTVPQVVFIRIGITSLILGVVFFITKKPEDLCILAEKPVLISVISMGLLFTLLHTCWYQAVRELPLTIASLIVIPSPIITAMLAFLITQEPLFYYHFVGIIGEIFLLVVLIFIQKNKKKIPKN